MGCGLRKLVGWLAFFISELPWKQLGGPAAWAGNRLKAFVALSASLVLLLPIGVLAQESAPSKLIVYLQRFRPQDYQRLLEVYGSREARGD